MSHLAICSSCNKRLAPDAARWRHCSHRHCSHRQRYCRTTAFRVTVPRAVATPRTSVLPCHSRATARGAQIPVSVFAGRAFLKTMTITGAYRLVRFFPSACPRLKKYGDESSFPWSLFWPERHGTERCYTEKMRTASRMGGRLRPL